MSEIEYEVKQCKMCGAPFLSPRYVTEICYECGVLINDRISEIKKGRVISTDELRLRLFGEKK